MSKIEEITLFGSARDYKTFQQVISQWKSQVESRKIMALFNPL